MSTSGPKYVLVVEDDRDIREGLADLLGDYGYTVRGASNGREALEVLGGPSLPSIILLDLMMPVMDGWQFMEEVSRRRELAGIPICIITAGDSKNTRGPNVVSVIRKPFDAATLMGVVERYC
ncbi:MAG TPA: response regulator [Polyangia bacterium]|jgi:CheY-like chemotaxis protein